MNNEIATPAYARALLAETAEKMCDAIDAVAKDETDPIAAHALAAVRSECKWCAENYGGNGK